MSTRVESELMTPAEAALELRVSVGTVKRWLRGGDLAGVRLPGGGWRIAVDDLRKLRTYPDHADRPANLRGRN
jgi:excisionase family DNA binding protein